MIAADGEEATVEMLRGWAANADIYANDVELLEAMAAGACEVGVANHYYLARLLEENPDTPIGLVWAEQDTPRGAHQHLRRRHHPLRRRRRARPAVPRVAGDRRPGHPRRRQPRVPGQPGVEAEPLIREQFGTDFVRDTLRADVLGSLNADAVRAMDTAGFG